MSNESHISTGEASLRLGCLSWHLSQLWARGLMPEPARVGRQRAIAVADLPRYAEALRQAKYIKAEPGRLAGVAVPALTTATGVYASRPGDRQP